MMKLLFAVMLLSAALWLGGADAPAKPFRVTLPAQTDQEIQITPPAPGIYTFKVKSRSTVPVGTEHTAQFQWDGGAWRYRRLLHPNQTEKSVEIDRIEFGNVQQRLKIRWSPERTELLDLQFVPEQPVKVPEAAQNYQLPFTPPADHPRLLVNPADMAKIRDNLQLGVNKTVWESVAAKARQPFVFAPDLTREVMYDPEVAAVISAKAFYYLITQDRKIGREAVDLTQKYLNLVTFGNGQDITRKVGDIIYRSAQVYDWCYDLMTVAEREQMRDRMLFYAAEMEIGWPPFQQSVAVGHGNEAQMSRDLLAMAIAVYNEDPAPLKYALYTLLEVFQPSKTYLYQSGRHDQGSGYGGYRHQWDLFAALQMRRTFGYELLPKETAAVPYYWYYLRTPDNRYLIEGDASWSWSNRYMTNAGLLLANLALWPDPELKAELRRGNPALDFSEDPVWFLLVNDPALLPQDRRAALPLTKFYREPLPGMAVRTGWNFNRLADDVVITMQGACYHYRNHQHLDAGSFQIYYRGNLAADLGQYKTYGIAYDWNFAKSSAAHSVMLFRDPEQKTRLMGPQFTANSGTQEIDGWWPAGDLAEQIGGSKFRNGDTPRAGWGPAADRPLYSFMETNLGILYPGRVKNYWRTFVFVNLGLADTPAALLILDRFQTASDRIEPVFQLGSFATPQTTSDGVKITASPYGRTGKLVVQTVLPPAAKTKILTGKAAFTVGDESFTPSIPDAPETQGSRTEITGKGDVFLHMLQIQDGDAKVLPVKTSPDGARLWVQFADRLIGLGDAAQVSAAKVTWRVDKADTQTLLLDLAPGVWELRQDGKILGRTQVAANDGSFFAVLPAGFYTLTPAPGSTAPELKKPESAAPVTPPPPGNQVLLDGKPLPEVRTVAVGTPGQFLLPLAKLAPQGLSADGRTLRLNCRGREIVLKEGDRELAVGALTLPLAQPLTVNEFLLPAPLAAGLLGLALELDADSGTALLKPVKNPGNVLMVDGGEESYAFWRLLSGETGEWAAFGRRIPVDVYFIEPRELDEIALKWARGTLRQTSFGIELSADGKTFCNVFDGVSSGKTDDFEVVKFARQNIRIVRFTFRGSQVGPWNQLSAIRFGR